MTFFCLCNEATASATASAHGQFGRFWFRHEAAASPTSVVAWFGFADYVDDAQRISARDVQSFRRIVHHS